MKTTKIKLKKKVDSGDSIITEILYDQEEALQELIPLLVKYFAKIARLLGREERPEDPATPIKRLFVHIDFSVFKYPIREDFCHETREIASVFLHTLKHRSAVPEAYPYSYEISFGKTNRVENKVFNVFSIGVDMRNRKHPAKIEMFQEAGTEYVTLQYELEGAVMLDEKYDEIIEGLDNLYKVLETKNISTAYK